MNESEKTYPTDWKPCSCGKPGTPAHQRRELAADLHECAPLEDVKPKPGK